MIWAEGHERVFTVSTAGGGGLVRGVAQEGAKRNLTDFATNVQATMCQDHLSECLFGERSGSSAFMPF